MDKSYIFGILAFALIAISALVIKNHERVIDFFVLSYDDYYLHLLIKDIEKEIWFHDYDHFIINTSDGEYTTWFADTTTDWKIVNVFAEFTITILSRSLDKLVVETSNDPRSQDGRTKLKQWSWEYQIILWEWYEWTQKVVAWP